LRYAGVAASEVRSYSRRSADAPPDWRDEEVRCLRDAGVAASK